MIETVSITSKRGRSVVLNRCSLTVRTGEVLGVVGRSGAGKSQLLSILSGQVAPDRGQILLDGRDVSRKPRRLSAITGYTTHEIPGPLDMSVGEWLNFWLRMADLPETERARRLLEARERFTLPDTEEIIANCGLGQRRAADLVRVFAARPKLYLLDGASQGIDGNGLRALTAAIQEAAACGATVVLAESAPHLPAAGCDRIVVLQDGAVAAQVKRGQPEFESMIATSQGWAE